MSPLHQHFRRDRGCCHINLCERSTEPSPDACCRPRPAPWTSSATAPPGATASSPGASHSPRSVAPRSSPRRTSRPRSYGGAVELRPLLRAPLCVGARPRPRERQCRGGQPRLPVQAERNARPALDALLGAPQPPIQ